MSTREELATSNLQEFLKACGLDEAKFTRLPEEDRYPRLTFLVTSGTRSIKVDAPCLERGVVVPEGNDSVTHLAPIAVAKAMLPWKQAVMTMRHLMKEKR